MGMYNILVSFAAAIGGFLFGYEVGVISQVLSMNSFGIQFGYKMINTTSPSLEVIEDKAAFNDISGNITFIFLLGCIIGTLVVSIMADRLGRKWSISVGTLAFTVGALIQTFSSAISVLYVGRVIGGLGIGILATVVPLFLSETAETRIRGQMIAVQQLMITIGIVVASCINAVIIVTVGKNKITDLEWRLALGMQAVPGVFLLIIMLFMPYSPRWLMNQNRHSEAIHVLARLRAADVSSDVVQTEFREIKDSIEHERQIGNANWAELFKKGIFNRVVIIFILQSWQQWTGINAILYYQNDLIKKMGFDDFAASIPFPIANNFVNFISTFPGMWAVEKLGRRKLLIFGGLGMATSHLLVVIFLSLAESNRSYAWGAIFSIYMFFFSFASTWGPTTWVYQSEIFPLRVRAKGSSLGSFSNWATNALIAKVNPLITDKIGRFVYLIYACTGLMMALFTYGFVPETMGKSLEDMDVIFGASDLPGENPLRNDEKNYDIKA